jgi:hypothetical protein
MATASFLLRYLETLDNTPDEVLPLLAPNIKFCVLWSANGEAQEFAGGMKELEGYYAQRQPDGQFHHVELASREGNSEVALGYTTRNGERLGTFTMAAQVDEQGRAVRLYASRTTSLPFDPVGD